MLDKHAVMLDRLVSDNAELRTELEQARRRLAYYENPHSPPSSRSLPSQKRKKSRSSGSKSPAPSGGTPGRREGHGGV